MKTNSSVRINKRGAQDTGSGSASESRLLAAGVAAVVFAGAIFGFFYAWVCSTMWGLDKLPPQQAIEAMNAINSVIRNAVFFPAFFLTPVVLIAVAGLAVRSKRKKAAALFLSASIVYLVGGILVTALINIPMNNELQTSLISGVNESAEKIWSDYSGRWQLFNLLRTAASGIALALAASGVFYLRIGDPIKLT